MADQETVQNPDKKKSKLGTMLLIVGLLVGEAGLIFGLIAFMGGPSEVSAGDDLPDMNLSEDDKIVELLVLDAKLPNARSGVTFVYNTEIYVQVRQKHSGEVTDELERFQNEIRAEIGAIWRTSEPHQFQEPKLESLTRKVYALLNERFGTDADSGEPIVLKCVLVMGTGFRIDG